MPRLARSTSINQGNAVGVRKMYEYLARALPNFRVR